MSPCNSQASQRDDACLYSNNITQGNRLHSSESSTAGILSSSPSDAWTMTSLRFSPSHSSSAVATQNLQLISKAIEEDESSKTSKLTSSKVPSSSSTVSSLKQHDIVQLHKQAPHNQSLYLISKAIEQEESAIRKHSISKVPSSSCEASLIKEYNNDQQQQSLPITATATTTTKEDWCSNNRSSQHQHQMVAMPAGFVPSPYDVLCGRGRVCKSAAGNMAYRDAILRSLDEYAAAENKLSKGNIITEIMDSVRKKCHDYHGKNPNVGGFVKCVNGAWFEVGDFLAREKTSQCFRDALATHYSSSAQSKYLRRRAKEHPDYFPFDSTESGFSRKNSLSSSTGESSAAGIATMNEVLLLDMAPTQQLPFKKRKRRPSEDAAADVLQHMPSCSQAPPPESLCSLSSPMASSVISMSNTMAAAAAGQPKQELPLSSVPRPGSTPELVSLLHFSLAASSRSCPTAPPMTATAVSTKTMPPLSNSSSGVNVCALQPALRAPSESPWGSLLRVQRQMEAIAETEAVDLFVLPELSPVGYSEDTFARYLPITPANQAMYQEFDRFFQIAARNLNTYICYGTIGWSFERQQRPGANNSSPRLFIRQIVVDRLGTQVACYDKTFLCDYGVCAETRFFQPGPASHPTSFQVYSRDRSCSFRFGLLICADMRDPGLSRRLTADAEHRVDCILQPAAFARDCSFRSWSSFRETRAVENSIFWIGVNYSGMDFGETSIVPPFVDEEHEPITLGCDEGYLIGRVTRSALDHVRTSMPFYRNLLEESVKR